MMEIAHKVIRKQKDAKFGSSSAVLDIVKFPVIGTIIGLLTLLLLSAFMKPLPISIKYWLEPGLTVIISVLIAGCYCESFRRLGRGTGNKLTKDMTDDLDYLVGLFLVFAGISFACDLGRYWSAPFKIILPHLGLSFEGTFNILDAVLFLLYLIALYRIMRKYRGRDSFLDHGKTTEYIGNDEALQKDIEDLRQELAFALIFVGVTLIIPVLAIGGKLSAPNVTAIVLFYPLFLIGGTLAFTDSTLLGLMERETSTRIGIWKMLARIAVFYFGETIIFIFVRGLFVAPLSNLLPLVVCLQLVTIGVIIKYKGDKEPISVLKWLPAFFAVVMLAQLLFTSFSKFLEAFDQIVICSVYTGYVLGCSIFIYIFLCPLIQKVEKILCK